MTSWWMFAALILAVAAGLGWWCFALQTRQLTQWRTSALTWKKRYFKNQYYEEEE